VRRMAERAAASMPGNLARLAELAQKKDAADERPRE
jgi:hypothetical protein